MNSAFWGRLGLRLMSAVLVTALALELGLRLLAQKLPPAIGNDTVHIYSTRPGGMFYLDPPTQVRLCFPNNSRWALANGYGWHHRTDERGFRNPPGVGSETVSSPAQPCSTPANTPLSLPIRGPAIDLMIKFPLPPMATNGQGAIRFRWCSHPKASPTSTFTTANLDGWPTNTTTCPTPEVARAEAPLGGLGSKRKRPVDRWVERRPAAQRPQPLPNP